jgi:hypothetical protein
MHLRSLNMESILHRLLCRHMREIERLAPEFYQVRQEADQGPVIPEKRRCSRSASRDVRTNRHFVGGERFPFSCTFCPRPSSRSDERPPELWRNAYAGCGRNARRYLKHHGRRSADRGSDAANKTAFAVIVPASPRLTLDREFMMFGHLHGKLIRPGRYRTNCT